MKKNHNKQTTNKPKTNQNFYPLHNNRTYPVIKKII